MSTDDYNTYLKFVIEGKIKWQDFTCRLILLFYKQPKAILNYCWNWTYELTPTKMNIVLRTNRFTSRDFVLPNFRGHPSCRLQYELCGHEKASFGIPLHIHSENIFRASTDNEVTSVLHPLSHWLPGSRLV